MKHSISFLSLLLVVFGMNYANASDCTGEECELSGIVMHQSITTPVKETENIDTVDEIIIPETETVCETSCDHDYNCPFDTPTECEVWNKKPVQVQAAHPRSSHFSELKMQEILYAINSQKEFTANDKMAKPLLQRYKILLRTSKACCTEGIIHKLNENKASGKQIYQFLKDDANRFAVGERCLLTANDEILSSYSEGVDGKMVSDVRNACLCKNHQWFDTLLLPFKDVYERAPQFEATPFNYTYTDGLRRNITVSVNEDVKKVMALLESCPK